MASLLDLHLHVLIKVCDFLPLTDAVNFAQSYPPAHHAAHAMFSTRRYLGFWTILNADGVIPLLDADIVGIIRAHPYAKQIYCFEPPPCFQSHASLLHLCWFHKPLKGMIALPDIDILKILRAHTRAKQIYNCALTNSFTQNWIELK